MFSEGNYKGKFPDYHFISGFGSVYIQFTQKDN